MLPIVLTLLLASGDTRFILGDSRPLEPRPSDWIPYAGGISYGADGGMVLIVGNLGIRNLGASSVSTGMLTSGSIDAETVVSDTVLADSVTGTTLTGLQANVRRLAVDKLDAGAVTTGVLVAGSAEAQSLKTKSFTTQTISVGSDAGVGGSLRVAGQLSALGGLLVTGRIETTYQDSSAGDATVNAASGRAAIPQGSTLITLTHPQVTPKTIIDSGLETLGTRATSVMCLPSTGSFTCTAVSDGEATEVRATAKFWWALR